MTIRISKFTALALAASLGGAAALAANVADAAAANKYRDSGASTPKPLLASQHAPSDYRRYDYGDSARSSFKPEPRHGIFSPSIGAP